MTARVLVVEDDALAARRLSRIVSELGHRVLGPVASGEEAVALATAEAPDLVLMDVRLRGEMDGTRAASEICERRADVPVVFLTALGDEETLARADASRPYAYLVKPIREEELRAAVRIALERSRSERELKRLHRTLAAVREVDRLIARGSDPDVLLGEACRILAAARQQTEGRVCLPDPETGTLRVRASSCGAEGHGEGPCPIAVEAWTTGRTVEGRPGNLAAVAVPIGREGRLRGVLCLHASAPEAFDEGEVVLLEEVAADLALALDAIESERRLHASEVRYRQLFSTMREGHLLLDATALPGGDRPLPVLEANPASEGLALRPPSGIKGRPLAQVLDSLDGERLRDLAAVADTGEPVRFELDAPRLHRCFDVTAYSPAPDRIALLLTDVTARKEKAERLQESAAELEHEVEERTAALAAAHEDLRGFAYAVAHDLKQPLRAIDAFAALLSAGLADAGTEEARAQLGRIRDGSRRMGLLIDGLLQMARIAGRKPSHERIDLAELARASLERLRRRDPRRQVEAVVPDSIAAVGDRALIRVVVDALVDNAWKFTAPRERARIELAVFPGRHEDVYTVTDNGIGFDMTFAGKLFGPFQRLHPGQGFEGEGIGLALVARAVRAHGGRVDARGEVGHGAAFSFSLPLRAVGQDQPGIARDPATGIPARA